MKLIFLGAPGSGKGTQAKILSDMLDVPTISTGNILRNEVREGTPIGVQVKEYIENGDLVPDDIIIDIVKKRIAEDDCANGYILDGMPRTIPQAEALEEHDVDIDCAISIEISDETIIERVTGRRVCARCHHPYHVVSSPPKVPGVCDFCGGELIIRKDDAPRIVKARLRVYHKQTEPLKDFYASRDLLIKVDNQPTIEGTHALILEALGLRR